MRLSTILTFVVLIGGAVAAIWAQGALPSLSVSAIRGSDSDKPAVTQVAAVAPQRGEPQVVSDATPAAPSQVAASEPTAPAVPAQIAQAQAATTPATPPAAPAPARPAAAPAEAKAAPAGASLPTCSHPGALGVSRVVQVDTTGGPGFGFEHFKMHDFLREKEVVLTFDDGPWPNNTPAVLKALADECVKAIFFPIGKHATYYPEILRQVATEGHTVGSHTWSHANLNRVKGDEARKEEIEKGFSAVNWALKDKSPSPFFRFPALQHPPEMVTYLGERNVGIFSTDMDSFDFKMRKPEQVVKSVMSKLEKHGKGIILMHDFQHVTAEALPELLAQLKAGGYKVVHMKAATSIKTIAKYDEELVKSAKLPTVSTRPTSSVIKTIAE